MMKKNSVSFPVTTGVASLSFFPGGNLNAGGAAIWTASGTIHKISVPYDAVLTDTLIIEVFDARKSDGSPMDSGGQRHLVTVGTAAALIGAFEAYGRAVTGTLDGTNRLYNANVPNVAVGTIGATTPDIEIPIGVFCPTGMIVLLRSTAGMTTANRTMGIEYTPHVLGGTRRGFAAKGYQYCV